MVYMRKDWIVPGVPIAKIDRKAEIAHLKNGTTWDLLNGIILSYGQPQFIKDYKEAEDGNE